MAREGQRAQEPGRDVSHLNLALRAPAPGNAVIGSGRIAVLILSPYLPALLALADGECYRRQAGNGKCIDDEIEWRRPWGRPGLAASLAVG
ncbi:hypothetical protein D3C72_1990570 [compost metagenome]